MAQTLYLPDGSCEVMIGDPADCLQKIIYERLGRDCEELFLSLFEDYKAEIEDRKERAKEFEQNADGYMQMCHEAVDNLNECIKLVDSPGRLDEKLLREKLLYAKNCLWTNL